MSAIQRAGTFVLGLLLAATASVSAMDCAAQRRLSQYRIALLDVLDIDVSKTLPATCYRLETYDVLRIRVSDPHIDGYNVVDNDGMADLGMQYGRVKVVGRNVEEASAAVANHLRGLGRNPQVSLKAVLLSTPHLNTRRYLVRSDGTVDLLTYGTVRVAGKTLSEARAAIGRRLAQYQLVPVVALEEVRLDKNARVITGFGGGQFDQIVGGIALNAEKTAADALQECGFRGCGDWTVRLVRPREKEHQENRILCVDSQSSTQSQYRADMVLLRPGDRLFVGDMWSPVAKACHKVYRATEPRRRRSLRRQ